ncbi:MAG TPA: FAD:protein FMN transferase [Kofleriaceae bacterium]|nr:FAD:protein FMN transferase [Kofleriaceae bacterium]
MSRAPALVAGLLLLAAAPPRAAAAPSGTDRIHERSIVVMGTRVTLTMWTDDEALAAAAAQRAFDEFRRLDKLMSLWIPDSDVLRINAAAGVAPVAVSDDTLAVMRVAAAVSRASGGAFDVTVGAFHGLWKFDQDVDGTIPDKAAVLARKKLVNWRDVVIDDQKKTVFLRRKGMAINLGGVAKGYAVDKARPLIERDGLSDYILRAGGDLYVSGRHGARQWVVGIRDPRGPAEDSFAAAALENCTFSTSGDYERFVVKDGVRYHHILDPKTAYPAWKSRSVTVMARDATTADAWSKPLFILGPVDGMKLLAKVPGLEAVWVDDKNQVTVSAGLKDKLKILHPPTPGI